MDKIYKHTSVTTRMNMRINLKSIFPNIMSSMINVDFGLTGFPLAVER